MTFQLYGHYLCFKLDSFLEALKSALNFQKENNLRSLIPQKTLKKTIQLCKEYSK
jgi:hypothetical protein